MLHYRFCGKMYSMLYGKVIVSLTSVAKRNFSILSNTHLIYLTTFNHSLSYLLTANIEDTDRCFGFVSLGDKGDWRQRS